MTRMTDLNNLAESVWRCAGCGVPTPDIVKRCDCATMCAFRRDAVGSIVLKTELEAQAEKDLSYLEQADAHADEGPLGEPAARSILAIALRWTRIAGEVAEEKNAAALKSRAQQGEGR